MVNTATSNEQHHHHHHHEHEEQQNEQHLHQPEPLNDPSGILSNSPNFAAVNGIQIFEPIYQPNIAEKNLKVASVTLPNGHKRDFHIHKNSKGNVLFDLAAESETLLEKDYFGLRYEDELGEMTWLYPDKRIQKQLKHKPWNFVFQIKFYPPEPSALADDLTRYLLYLQIRKEIYEGKLPASYAKQILLAAMVMQAEIGDFEAIKQSPNDYEHFLREQHLIPQIDEEVLTKVREAHKEQKGLTPNEAHQKYLDTAKDLAKYGFTFFNAKDSKNNPVIIGVYAHGICVYKDQLQIHRFFWQGVNKIQFRGSKFSVVLKPGELDPKKEVTVNYKLTDYTTAKKLYRTAVEHHTFFRLIKPEDKPKGTFLRRWGSDRFRYQGRTYFQAKMASQMFDHPSQVVTIQRTPSGRQVSRSVDDLAQPRSFPTSPMHYVDETTQQLTSPEKSKSYSLSTSKADKAKKKAEELSPLSVVVHDLEKQQQQRQEQQQRKSKRNNSMSSSGSSSPCSVSMASPNSGEYYVKSSYAPEEKSTVSPYEEVIFPLSISKEERQQQYQTPIQRSSTNRNSRVRFSSDTKPVTPDDGSAVAMAPAIRPGKRKAKRRLFGPVNDDHTAFSPVDDLYKAAEISSVPLDSRVTLYDKGWYTTPSTSRALSPTGLFVGCCKPPRRTLVSERLLRNRQSLPSSSEYYSIIKRPEIEPHPIRYFVEVYHSGKPQIETRRKRRFMPRKDVDFVNPNELNKDYYNFPKEVCYDWERTEYSRDPEGLPLKQFSTIYWFGGNSKQGNAKPVGIKGQNIIVSSSEAHRQAQGESERRMIITEASTSKHATAEEEPRVVEIVEEKPVITVRQEEGKTITTIETTTVITTTENFEESGTFEVAKEEVLPLQASTPLPSAIEQIQPDESLPAVSEPVTVIETIPKAEELDTIPIKKYSNVYHSGTSHESQSPIEWVKKKRGILFIKKSSTTQSQTSVEEQQPSTSKETTRESGGKVLLGKRKKSSEDEPIVAKIAHEVSERARTFSMSKNYPELSKPFEGQLKEIRRNPEAPSANLFDCVSFADGESITDEPKTKKAKQSRAARFCLACVGGNRHRREIERKSSKIVVDEPKHIDERETTRVEEVYAYEPTNVAEVHETIETITKYKKYDKIPEVIVTHDLSLIPATSEEELLEETLPLQSEVQHSDFSQHVETVPAETSYQEDEIKTLSSVKVPPTPTPSEATFIEENVHQKQTNEQIPNDTIQLSGYPLITEPYIGEIEILNKNSEAPYGTFKIEHSPIVVTQAEKQMGIVSQEEQIHITEETHATSSAFQPQTSTIITEYKEVIPAPTISKRTKMLAEKKHYPLIGTSYEGEISEIQRQPDFRESNLFDTISFQSNSDDSGLGADSGPKKKSGGLICIPKSKKSKTVEREKINYTEVQTTRNKKVKRARLFSFSKHYPEIGTAFEGEVSEMAPVQQAPFTNLFDEINFAPDENVEIIKQEIVTKEKTKSSSGIWCVPTSKKQKRTTSIPSIKSEEFHQTKLSEKAETYSLSQYYPEVGTSFEGELSEINPTKDVAHINIFDAINFAPKQEEKIEIIETVEKPKELKAKKEKSSTLLCMKKSKRKTSETSSASSLSLKDHKNLHALQTARNKFVRRARLFSFSKHYPEIGGQMSESELINELTPVQQAPFTNLFDEISFASDENIEIEESKTLKTKKSSKKSSNLLCGTKSKRKSSKASSTSASSGTSVSSLSLKDHKNLNAMQIARNKLVQRARYFSTSKYYPEIGTSFDGELIELQPVNEAPSTKLFDEISFASSAVDIKESGSQKASKKNIGLPNCFTCTGFKSKPKPITEETDEFAYERVTVPQDTVREEKIIVTNEEPALVEYVEEPLVKVIEEPIIPVEPFTKVVEETHVTKELTHEVHEHRYNEELVEIGLPLYKNKEDTEFTETTIFVPPEHVTIQTTVIEPQKIIEDIHPIIQQTKKETTDYAEGYPQLSEPYVGNVSQLSYQQQGPETAYTIEPQTKLIFESPNPNLLVIHHEESEKSAETIQQEEQWLIGYPQSVAEQIVTNPNEELIHSEMAFKSQTYPSTSAKTEEFTKSSAKTTKTFSLPWSKKKKLHGYPLYTEAFDKDVIELKRQPEAPEKNLFDTISFQSDSDDSGLGADSGINMKKSGGLICIPKSKKSKAKTAEIEKINYTEVQTARNKKVKRARLFSFSKHYPEIGTAFEGEISELTPVQQAPFTNLFDEINFAPDENVEIIKQELLIKDKPKSSSGIWCVPTSKKQKRTTSIPSIKSEEFHQTKLSEKAETYSLSQYYPEVGTSFEGELSEINPTKDVAHINIFDAINFAPKQEEKIEIIETVEKPKELKAKKEKSSTLLCMKKSKRKTSETSSASSLSLKDHKNLHALQTARNKFVRRARLFSFSKHYPEIGAALEGEISELRPAEQAPFTNLFDEISFASDEVILHQDTKVADVQTKSKGLWCMPGANKQKRTTSIPSLKAKELVQSKSIEKAETYSLSQYYPEVGTAFEGELSETIPAKDVEYVNIFDAINFAPKHEKVEIIETVEQPQLLVKEKRKSKLWCVPGAGKRKTSSVSSRSDESIQNGTLNALQVARNKIVQRARTFSMSENYPNQGEVFKGELMEISPVAQAPSANLFDCVSFDDEPPAVVFTLESMATLNKDLLPRERPNYLLACLTCGNAKFRSPHYPAITEPYGGEVTNLQPRDEIHKTEMSEFVSSLPTQTTEKEKHVVKTEKVEIQQSAYSEYPDITEAFTGELNSVYPQRDIDLTNLNEYVTFENGSEQLDSQLSPVKKVNTAATDQRAVEESSPVQSTNDVLYKERFTEEQILVPSVTVQNVTSAPELIITEISELTPKDEIPKYEITEHISFTETGEGSYRRVSQVVAAQKHIIISDEAPEMISAVTVMDEPITIECHDLTPSQEIPSKNLFDTISFQSESDDSGLGGDSQAKAKKTSGGLICIPKSKKSKAKTTEIEKINYTEVQTARNKKVKRARLFSFSKHYPEIGTAFEGEVSEMAPVQQAPFTNLFDEINFAPDENVEIIKQELLIKEKPKSSSGIWCVKTSKKQKRTTSIPSIKSEESIKKEVVSKVVENAEAYSLSQYYPEVGTAFEGELSEINPTKDVEHINIFDAINFAPKQEKIEIIETVEKPKELKAKKDKSSTLLCMKKSKRKTSETSSASSLSLKDHKNLNAMQIARNRIVRRARYFSTSKHYPEIGAVLEGEISELQPVKQAPFTNLFDEIDFASDEVEVKQDKEITDKKAKPKSRGLWCVPGTETQKRTLSITSEASIKVLQTKPIEKAETYSLSQYYPEVGTVFEGDLSEINPAKDVEYINIFDAINFAPKHEKVEIIETVEQPQLLVKEKRKSKLWCVPGSDKQKRTTSITSEESIKKGTLNKIQIARNKAVERARTFSMSHHYPEIGTAFEGEISELAPVQQPHFTNLFDEIDFEPDVDVDKTVYKKKEIKQLKRQGRGTSFLWCAPKHYDYSSYPSDIKPYTGELKELSIVEEAPSANLFDCVSFASTDDVNQDLLLNGHVVSQPTLFEHQQPIIIEQESVTVPYGYPVPTEIYEGEIDNIKPQKDYDHINIYERIEQVPKGISYVPPPRKPSFLEKIRRASFRETSNENISYERETIREEVQHVQKSEPMTIPTIIEPVEILEKTEDTATTEMPVIEEVYIVEEQKITEPIQTFHEQTMETDISLTKTGDISYHNETTIIPDVYITESVESDKIPAIVEELKNYPAISEPFIGELSTIKRQEEAQTSHLFDEINFLIVEKQSEKPEVTKAPKTHKFLWCGGKRSESPETIKAENAKKFRSRVRTFSMSKHYPEISAPYEGQVTEIAPSNEAPSRNLFDEISFASAESESQKVVSVKDKAAKRSSLWCVPTSKKQKRTTSIPSIKSEEFHQTKPSEKAETYSLSQYYPELGTAFEGELSEINPTKDVEHINIFDAINFVPKQEKIEIIETFDKPKEQKEKKDKSSTLLCMKKSKRKTSETSSASSLSLKDHKNLHALQTARNKFVRRARLFSFSKHYPQIGGEMNESELINELTPVQQAPFTNLFDEISFASDENIEIEESKKLKTKKSSKKSSNLLCGTKSKRKSSKASSTSSSSGTSVSSLSLKDHKNLNAMQIARNKLVQRARYFSTSKYYPEIGTSFDGELIELQPVNEAPSTKLFDEISFASSTVDIKEIEKVKVTKEKQPSNNFAACLACAGRKAPQAKEEPYEVESIGISKSLDIPSSTEFENASTLVVVEKDLAMQTSPEHSVDLGYPVISEPYAGEISNLNLTCEIEFTSLPKVEREQMVEPVIEEPSDELRETEHIVTEEREWISGMPEVIQSEHHHDIVTTHHVTSETTVTEHFEAHQEPVKAFTSYEQILTDYPQLTAAYDSEADTLTKVSEVQPSDFEIYEQTITEPTVINQASFPSTNEQRKKESVKEAMTYVTEPISTTSQLKEEKLISKRTKMLAEKKHYPLIGTSYDGKTSELQRQPDFRESNLFDTISFQSNSDDSGLGADSGPKKKSGGLICISKSKKSKAKTVETEKINYTEVQTARNKKVKRARLFSFSKHYPEIGTAFEGEISELAPVQQTPFTNLFDEINFAPDENVEIIKQELPIKEKPKSSSGIWCVPTSKKQKRTTSIPSIKSEESIKQEVVSKAETYSLSQYYPEIGTAFEGELSEINPTKDVEHINIFDAINFVPKQEKIEIIETFDKPKELKARKDKSSTLLCKKKSKRKTSETSSASSLSLKDHKNLNALQIARNRIVRRARYFSTSKNYPEIGAALEGEISELQPVKQAPFTNLFDEISFASDEVEVKQDKEITDKKAKPKSRGLWCVPGTETQKRTLSITSEASIKVLQTKPIEKAETYSLSQYYPEVGTVFEGDLSEINPTKDVENINIFDAINFAPKQEKVEIIETVEQPQLLAKEKRKSKLWCVPGSDKQKRTTSITSEESIKKGTLNKIQIARNKAVERARTFSMSHHYPEIGTAFEGEVSELAPAQQPQFTNLFDEIDFEPDVDEKVVVKLKKSKKSAHSETHKMAFCAPFKTASKHYPALEEPYVGTIFDTKLKHEAPSADLFKCVDFASSNEQGEEEDKIGRMQSEERQPRKQMATLYFRRNTKQLEGYPLLSEAYKGEVAELLRHPEVETTNLFDCVTFASESDDEIPISQSSNARDSSKKGSPDKPKKKQLRLFGKTRRSTSDKELDLSLYPKTEEAYSGQLKETTKAEEINPEKIRKIVNIYHSGYSQPLFFRHRFIREKHEGIEEIGDAPADYEISHFTAEDTTPLAPMLELEALPLRSYAKYPIVSYSESPRDMKRKFSKSKIIPESSSESSSQSESETDTVPSLKPSSKKKESEGFLSFFKNRLTSKQHPRKKTGYEGLVEAFSGSYETTPKSNEMPDQPILEHVLVYHNGSSTQQPIDSGFEDGANASETERAGTFKRTGKLFFDKFKLSRDSGDKTTTEEIDKSESLEPKRIVVLTGYENLNTVPFLGLHSTTTYAAEVEQQPLALAIDTLPATYYYEGDAILTPIPAETTESKVSTLERIIIKSKKPRKDSNFAFLSVEGPVDETDKKGDISDLPIGEHVTVYHCGRSDVPTAEVPPEVYVYEKEPIISESNLSTQIIEQPQHSQIEHITNVQKTKRDSLKRYPEPFRYEGPIESLERLPEAEKQKVNEYVNIYHSGYSTDSGAKKSLIKQESKTEKQRSSRYSFDTTPFEGEAEKTFAQKELAQLPLREHALIYHPGKSEVQDLEDLEEREIQRRELSLIQRLMAMFKKRELQGYPSTSEEYKGHIEEINRSEDIEKSELKNVTNVYHSGYSYDPKTSKLTLRRFAPRRRLRVNMNDYPTDSAPLDAVIYDLHTTEDIPKTPSPVTLPPESLIFKGPPKPKQSSRWYRFWFLRRRGQSQSGSSGLEASMPIVVEAMSHRITDTSSTIIMGTTDRSLFSKGHWPVTDIDVDVMLKTITKCQCECEALIIEKTFETGIAGSVQLQQTLNNYDISSSFRMDNNCIMQTSNGTWLAKVTKKISTQMEQIKQTDNTEKAELFVVEKNDELNDEVPPPTTSVVKEEKEEEVGVEKEEEDEIEVSRNSVFSKWDCEPPYLWSAETYKNLEELIDDNELNVISTESGELPLTHEKKELKESSVRDSEMFASIRRRLSEKLAKKEKKKEEKRLKKEEKERKKHAGKSGSTSATSGHGHGHGHGASTGGYASESSSSSASVSDAEIEERHVVISKAIEGPVQSLNRGRELGDLDNIEEDIDNNNKKLVKMAPQTSMGASAVNNIEANSSGPYTPAKEKDGRIIREETVEQVYRISGTGHAPNLDPNDMSLQSTVDKCIRDTERMPRVQMVEANVLVKECEPLPHGISEGSAPHTTLHSWHETEDGPETITTEVDEHGNKITRTIKTQTTKHTIQKQTYQTYAVEDKDKPDQTIIQTKESTIPLGNKSVTRSPVVHTKTRTVAYEKGSEPHENIDPIGELVSTKTITTGNRTVEILTYKTEKDGVIETRVEHRVTIHSGDNIDHDAELAKALLEATEMSPDLIINRVEVEKQTQR